MKSAIRYIAALAALLSLAASCVEDFEPDPKDLGGARLVIDGMVTSEPSVNRVKLSLSAPYGTVKEEFEPVSNASVTVTCDGETTVFAEEGRTGIYRAPEDFHGEIGRTYHLKVETDMPGIAGTYEAEDVMPESGVRADAFDYYQMTDSLWVFAIWGQDMPGIISNYAAEISINDGVLDEFGDWVFISGLQMFDGNYLNGGEYLFYYSNSDPARGEITPPLQHGDKVELYFYSISDYFYKYKMAMLDESIAHLPLFTAQPANLPTNVSGGAVGLFGCAYVTKMKLWIDDPQRTRLQMLQDHGMVPLFPKY